MLIFLWGDGENGLKCHWVGWKNCCVPSQEGDLGIRSMHDIVSSFSMKL